MSTHSSDPRPLGNLTARAPFGTSQLNVYDQAYKRVAHGTGYLDVQLPQGIYEVETISGDQRERKLVVVSPDHPGEVNWKLEDLQIRSAAPLDGTSTTHELHTGPAYTYSRQLTAQGPADADSRLFVFVRTLEPARYPEFDQGLQLLDAGGNVLSDFQSEVWRDADAGCLALTIDLPAGFYQIRRTAGHQARSQALWLSGYWETQVFIPAREYPLLADSSIFMAQKGEGFNPSDKLALATETVLEGLQRGVNLADSDMMRALLSGKFDNPWLGVLALHTMRQDPDSDPHGLRSIVEANVYNLLGDHPDVRALFLKPDQDAEQPFDVPPMLYASLRLVQEHATLHAGTIPPDSMTADLLPRMATDSPWVSWRDQAASVDLDDQDYGMTSFSIKSPSQGLGFGMAPDPHFVENQIHDLLVQQSRDGGPVIDDLVRIAEGLSMDGDTREVRYSLDNRARLDNLDAGEISKNSGYPLSQIEKSLSRLRSRPELLAQTGTLSPVERAIAQEMQLQSRRSGPQETGLDIRHLQIDLNQTLNRFKSLSSQIGALRNASQDWAARLEALRLILDQHQDGILITTYQGWVVYADSAVQQLTAYTSGQLIEASWSGTNTALQALAAAPFGKSDISLPIREGGQVALQLLKVDVREEVTPNPRIGMIDRLHRPDVLALDQGEMVQIRKILSNVRLYVSLLTYGDDAQRADYQSLTTRELEKLPG